jgi:hypothetical protein
LQLILVDVDQLAVASHVCSRGAFGCFGSGDEAAILVSTGLTCRDVDPVTLFSTNACKSYHLKTPD